MSKTSEINKVTSYGEILCSEVYNLEFKIPSSHIKKAKTGEISFSNRFCLT